jgi:hypothetical protein
MKEGRKERREGGKQGGRVDRETTKYYISFFQIKYYRLI